MMNYRFEITDMYNEYNDPGTLRPVEPIYPKENTNSQMYLTVPEQPEDSVNDESPIDRYGPRLRNTKVTARGSSCYSRDTEGHSLGEYDGYEQEYDDDGNAASDVPQFAKTQWAVPAPLSVNSTWYGTQYGSESKLILQGLSDPYKSGSSPISSRNSPNIYTTTIPPGSASTLDLSYPTPTLPLRVAGYQRTRVQTPPVMQEVWLDRPRHWHNSTISMSITPPIRPHRESNISPSFRTPTSLLSPFKTPPGFLGSSPQFGHYSVDPKRPYPSPKYSYPSKKELLIIILCVSLTTFCTALVCILALICCIYQSNLTLN
jgi:hypothetical protein